MNRSAEDVARELLGGAGSISHQIGEGDIPGPVDAYLFGAVTRAVRDALAQGRRKGAEWQPIETAPKDGWEVDLFGLIPGRIVNAHYHCGEWLYWSGDSEIGYEAMYRPTHWMPVPPAPALDPDTITTGERDGLR